MSKLRLAGFAGLLVVAALIGGTIIGSVAAGTISRSTQPSGPALAAPSGAPAAGAKIAEYCNDFLTAFATNLGVDESELAPAAKKAVISTIDAAVASGEMTKAAGDRIKARIEAADGDGCALLAGRLTARAGAAAAPLKAALGVVRDGMTAAADALGTTPAALGTELRGGKSLKDVATEKSVPYATVSAAVVAAVKKDLDAAVAAGTIPQARADRVLARLTESLANGRLGNGRAVAPRPASSAAPTTGS